MKQEAVIVCPKRGAQLAAEGDLVIFMWIEAGDGALSGCAAVAP